MVLTEIAEPVRRDWRGSPRETPAARVSPLDWPRRGAGRSLGQWDWGSENAGMKAIRLLYYILNEKFPSTVRSTQKEFDQNSAPQAACDTSIARVMGCVYPREGYRSVTLLVMSGSTGLRRPALFCARKLYNPH